MIRNSLDQDDLTEYGNFILDSLEGSGRLRDTDLTPTDTLNHELRQRLNSVLEELLQNVISQQEQQQQQQQEPGPSGELTE